MHDNFKKYRNKLNAIIKLSRKEYYFHKLQAASGQTSTTWKVLNDILGKSKGKDFPMELRDDNGATTDPKEMVDILNRYFVNIGINLSNSTNARKSSFIDTLFSRCSNSMFFKPINASEIVSIVNNIQDNKACGHDGLNTLINNDKIIHSIVDPLCHNLICHLCREISHSLSN